MDKNAIWKWLILVAAVAFSLIVVTPLEEKIRYGIDLIGGVSITVELDEDAIRRDVQEELRLQSEGQEISQDEVDRRVREIMRGAQDRALEVIRNRVDFAGTEEPVIFPAKNNRIVVQVARTKEEEVATLTDAILQKAFLEFRMVHENNEQLVNDLATKEPPEGYLLEMALGDVVYVPDPAFPSEKRDETYRRRLQRFNASSRYEFLLEKDSINGRAIYRPTFVENRRQLTGEKLDDARLDYLSLGQPVVNLEFDATGSSIFYKLTKNYAPGGDRNPDPTKFRRMAIVLDDTLYSAPQINEPIAGGRAQISGQFTVQTATFLANILRAGSLPAPLKIVEKRQVSPTLGADSIKSGIRAIAYGGIGVLCFMLIYYRICGAIANLALVLNLILLPLGMILAAGFLGIFATDVVSRGPIQLPVLTLPGLAGILLTVGMAVDANVLIFERIREESGGGKRLWTAITAGYDRAFVTIIDANLTTLLTGVILYIFGSGPIRGFAVTLCAGIIMSMFTALVVTKLFFGVLASTTKLKVLKMFAIVGDTAIDFVGKRGYAAVFSLIVILATWGLFVSKAVNNPGAAFGVDFTGGHAISYAFKEDVPMEDLRQTLSDAGIAGAHIQYQGEFDSDVKYVQIKIGSDPIGDRQPNDVIKEVLQEKYANAGLDKPIQEDQVGGQIGKELKSRALKSIILALLGIIIYLWIRFELGFAVGAIVALAHDVLFTVGLYSLFGRQLSLPIIAALLTIVGYSVNDTIVVFDRIREDLRLVRGKNFKEICNLSINKTLRRTLLTSFTTLMTVGMLLVFGGGAINDFALALCIGVLVGTYSSIFVATPVVLLWHKDRKPEFVKAAS
jgi:SecD/SecF fusion protein